MKASECRDLTVEELQQKMQDAQQELLHLRMQQASGQVENPLRIQTVRRDMPE